jgi:hypothetical protein
MNRPRVRPILAVAGLLAVLASIAWPQTEATAQADVWAPFRVLVGTWKGAGEGTPGSGTGVQTWAFILRGAYLRVQNKTTIAPSAQNPKGEVHEDMGVFSYDKARKAYILRQFHVEGFVNQYVLENVPAAGQPFVFVTESIENIAPGFRARLTYKFLDADTFEQTFDLAQPGKDFVCYSKGVMKRQKGAPK